MMPGGLLVRAVRVEAGYCDADAVREARARDKVDSAFEHARAAEVDAQRRALSLAPLFAPPRPVWTAPALVGAFGDAFVEGTGLEGASVLAWSHAVLELALRRALGEQAPFLAGLDARARGAAADAAHVLAQSGALMKAMLRLLRNPGQGQLMALLRRLHKLLEGVGVGEALLLPAIVEGAELLLLLERTGANAFSLAVIATDARGALRYHAVSAGAAPPKLKYRTCLVLAGVSKKHALDDVFWAALYNMTLNPHEGDTEKFYGARAPSRAFSSRRARRRGGRG